MPPQGEPGGANDADEPANISGDPFEMSNNNAGELLDGGKMEDPSVPEGQQDYDQNDDAGDDGMDAQNEEVD
eukprot:CAMPEP_0185604968 /NCGR_PEP_ID=MMETSP0436-20130131/3694_1 /TAXON_ID=626734 ORGANISM="Favella taraikaensis, Strain Fe Narragansett Bay" /NCGR_SAMPLE_ID=MMETSP0436 /ASSEMBLY_ACC=CAM_ASM_000390 /LENGTH=71 /DNA_ID=CAMNT_0028236001 /DNA_START=504 /DNA_END=719 /DNA_ORIENTATION=-